jgi:peptidyl-tRNA hydrolase
MNAGKVASQAGHAYLDAYLQALELNPEITKEYKNGYHGIKVCLAVSSLDEMLKAEQKAKKAGLPHALITDSGYTCFNGQYTITALGIGPARRDDVKKSLGITHY